MEKNLLSQKRKRTSYSSAQIVELERVFNMDNYLSLAGRLQLVEEMGLTENQVTVWFQNRRMKLKKESRYCPDSGNIVKKARRAHNMLGLVESTSSYESLQRPFLRSCDLAAQQLEVAKQMSYLASSKASSKVVPSTSTDTVYHNFSVAAHYSSFGGNRVNGSNYSCQVKVLEQDQQLQVQQQTQQSQQQLLSQLRQQQHQQPQSTLRPPQKKRSLLDAFFDSFTCTVYDDPLVDFIIESPSSEIFNQDEFYNEMCNFFITVDSPRT
ncbi:homeotic protein deformed-like [Copidosoma floridanum]|uniref:homeotic protein deformed-like n=1 Tax=Copidosoma floridanum TaxID=29053 RepID=UPI000C6FCA36|nr:homeotic protein deformed-like [Copidosoma floridanum]